MAGIMYLIYKGDKDYVFDIEGWQRFELTCAPQGCRRSDGKTWPRCPEPRRQVTCKLAKISDKVFVGKNLFKVFLSLDFHFYCKINWNIASYFRKVSGVLPVLAKLTPLHFTTNFVLTSWPIQLLILVRIHSWEWSVRRFPDSLRWHLGAKDPFGLAD